MNNTDIYVNMDPSFLSLSAIPTAAKSLRLWGGHRMESGDSGVGIGKRLRHQANS